MTPPLLDLLDQAAYHAHYIQMLCKSPTTCCDGIVVYFGRNTFYHAFFESVVFKDDTFSLKRAERMDWIVATLQDPNSDRFQGWCSRKKVHEPHRRVEVVHEDFVVVLQISKSQQGVLKANFVTCYHADRSINAIRKSPLWSRDDCENAL